MRGCQFTVDIGEIADHHFLFPSIQWCHQTLDTMYSIWCMAKSFLVHATWS